MDSNENKLMAVICIILIIMTGVYHRGIVQTRESIKDITFDFTELRIDKSDLSGINVTFVYNLNNPSKIPLIVSIEGLLYYEYLPLAPFLLSESIIPPNSSKIITTHLILNNTRFHTIEDPENKRMYNTRGTLTIVGKYLSIIKVEVTDDINAYPIHN